MQLLARFDELLRASSYELYADNRERMRTSALVPTPNEIADDDLELFFAGVDDELIELRRGDRFNTCDRPTPAGRWSLLSRSAEGGWFNAEYLPQLAA